MLKLTPLPANYNQLLADVQERIRSAQYAALKAVNTELVGLYWNLGRMIVERQVGETWGKSVVEKLSADLQREFPAVGGFSASNLWRMKAFFELYREDEKLAPLVREIAMQFYLATLDRQVRQQDENPSIGIILCKEKSRTIVEYTLHDANKPIGVATYEITRTLPKALKGQLPRPEEIAALLVELAS